MIGQKNISNNNLISCIAGTGGVAKNQIVMIVNEKVYQCDGDNKTHAGFAIGIAKQNINQDENGKIQISGEFYDSSLNLVSGNIYYVGIGGTISDSSGSGFSQKIGIAKNEHTLIIDLGEAIVNI